MQEATACGLLPEEAVASIKPAVYGLPVFGAGSAFSAIAHGRAEWGDIDLFVPSFGAMVAVGQSMLDQGYTLGERDERVWYRLVRYGTRKWHTNSVHFFSRDDVPVNLVFKLVGGQPTASLAQVLESFDFGLLAVGWDAESDVVRDLRPYLFPDRPVDGPLPMLPNKRDNWVRGFISQYNGLREAARYAKYHGYGYDMSAVKQDLVTGYDAAALYHIDHFDEGKRLLGQIYLRLSELISADDMDGLSEAYKSLDFNDPLDQIMEALE